MESILPLFSLLTLCLSAAGLYLLYISMVQTPGQKAGEDLRPADIQKKQKQQKWGLILLALGFAGGVMTLIFLG